MKKMKLPGGFSTNTFSGYVLAKVRPEPARLLGSMLKDAPTREV